MKSKELLIRTLQRRWLTSLDAAQTIGVWALSQRCSELRRADVKVIDKWVRLPSGKRVKAYRITGGLT